MIVLITLYLLFPFSTNVTIYVYITYTLHLFLMYGIVLPAAIVGIFFLFFRDYTQTIIVSCYVELYLSLFKVGRYII